jgi:hydroxyacylglutathione hydrolase
MTSTAVDFATGAPVRGDLDVRWIHGLRGRRGRKGADLTFQVHAYDPHTYVLRQNKAVSSEAPFLYLLFGPCRDAVAKLILRGLWARSTAALR